MYYFSLYKIVICHFVTPGLVEYYTFKPVAIGAELLVYYGDGYFVELGYVVDTIEPADRELTLS